MKHLARGVTAQRGVLTAITSGLLSGRLVLSLLSVPPVAARTRIGIKQARIKGKENSMSEALRLADAMTHYFDERGPDAEEVAAELRRLHAEYEAMKEALKEAEKLDADANALAVSSSALADSVDGLVALNAELVEALRGTVAEMLYVLDALNNERTPHDGDEFHERLEKARAALAKVEASK